MEDRRLIVEKRALQGSADSRRLRKEGTLPGVIYGEGNEAQAIQVKMHDFELILHHHASESLLIEIDLEDEGNLAVLVKEVQHHPVTSELMHVDLQKVSMDKPIVASIPIELVGESEGAKMGGVVEHLLHEIDVECLPGDLIDTIKVDVSELKIGDSLAVEDLDTCGGKFRFLQDAESTVVAIAGPNVESDDDEESASEPEVIRAKKVEE